MKINWKYAIINTAIAGIFGITTGKLINLVEYYKGLSEGIMDGAQKGSDELKAKHMGILAMKDKEIEGYVEKYEELKEIVKNYRTLEKVNELAEETDDNIEESKKNQSELFDQVFGLENLNK